MLFLCHTRLTLCPVCCLILSLSCFQLTHHFYCLVLKIKSIQYLTSIPGEFMEFSAFNVINAGFKNPYISKPFWFSGILLGFQLSVISLLSNPLYTSDAQMEKLGCYLYTQLFEHHKILKNASSFLSFEFFFSDVFVPFIATLT